MSTENVGLSAFSHPRSSTSRRGLAYVAFAVLLFSTSPVLVRWAAPLSALSVTAGRMLVGAVVVALIGLLRGEPPRWHWKDVPSFALWGMITALHFLCYVASLSFTTVAHSLAITYTSPIWVTLFSALFLHESIPRRKFWGIGLTVLGMVILSGFEPRWSSTMLIGDLLALGSAVAFGLYSVVGRSQRDRYPLWTYASGVYGMAGLWLVAPAALSWSSPPEFLLPFLSVLALGVFPLGLGHTLYNAALRYTHPTLVNIVATQEVTGGVLLSWLILGEVPSLNAVVGALLMLCGVIWVVRR